MQHWDDMIEYIDKLKVEIAETKPQHETTRKPLAKPNIHEKT